MKTRALLAVLTILLLGLILIACATPPGEDQTYYEGTSLSIEVSCKGGGQQPTPVDRSVEKISPNGVKLHGLTQPQKEGTEIVAAFQCGSDFPTYAFGRIMGIHADGNPPYVVIRKYKTPYLVQK